MQTPTTKSSDPETIIQLQADSARICSIFSRRMRTLLNSCDGDEQVSVVLAGMIEWDIDPIAYAKDFFTPGFLEPKWT